MRTVSQRELRRHLAAVLAAVAAGDTVVVTRRGRPVARLEPVTEQGLPLVSPAAGRPRYVAWPRVRSTMATGDVLRDLRGDR